MVQKESGSFHPSFYAKRINFYCGRMLTVLPLARWNNDSDTCGLLDVCSNLLKPLKTRMSAATWWRRPRITWPKLNDLRNDRGGGERL